jgi:hypothetical protein
MIYLFENGDNNASVVYDETTLTNGQKANGIAIESLPIAETPEGKQAVLKCKKATEEVWYEYVDIPVNNTEQRIADLEIAMAAIMGGAL